MKGLASTLLATLVTVVSISPLWAESLDPRAVDAVTLFEKACIDTNGSKQKIVELFDRAKWDFGLFNQLPSDAVARLQGGRLDGFAYAIKSPNRAALLVEFNARGICGVRVHAADESSMRLIFDMELQVLALKLKGDLRLQQSSTKDLGEYKTTFRAWRVEPKEGGGKAVLVAITTADHPGPRQQHLMTLSH